MNITEIEKYKKSEQHFYDGRQNRIQLHFGEPNNKHIQIQQRSNKPQNSQRKRLKKIFNQQLTSIQFLYLYPKNQKNIKLYNKKNKQNHKINTTSLKENKTHTLITKLLTENHNESKKTNHHKLKDTLSFT